MKVPSIDWSSTVSAWEQGNVPGMPSSVAAEMRQQMEVSTVDAPVSLTVPQINAEGTTYKGNHSGSNYNTTHPSSGGSGNKGSGGGGNKGSRKGNKNTDAERKRREE
jgi:hypothetical protein